MKLPKVRRARKVPGVGLRLLGRDHNTIDSYTRTAGHFYDYVARQRPGLSNEQLAEGYLTMRVKRDDVSASTQNHDLAALNAPICRLWAQAGNVDALRAKRPHSPATALPRPSLWRWSVAARHAAMSGTAAGSSWRDRTAHQRVHWRALRKDSAAKRTLHPLCEIRSNRTTDGCQFRRCFGMPSRSRRLPGRVFEQASPAPSLCPSRCRVARKSCFSPNPQRHPETKQFMRWHQPPGDVQHALPAPATNSNAPVASSPYYAPSPAPLVWHALQRRPARPAGVDGPSFHRDDRHLSSPPTGPGREPTGGHRFAVQTDRMKLPLSSFTRLIIFATHAHYPAAKGGWVDILCMLHGAQNRAR